MRSRKLMSLCLVGSLMLSACALLLSGCARRDMRPVLRFAIASDVHVEDEGRSEVEEARLETMWRMAYRHADESPTGYHGLDAVVFAGDFTNRGTLSSMQTFKQICETHRREGTELVVSLGNHEFFSDGDTTVERYAQVFSVPEDQHLVLNGFHMIKLSPDGEAFGKDKLDWLRRELEAAAKDTPRRPVFVIQHQHVKGTVYGSTGWGVDGLYEVLKDFPQAVDFSGHSHFPIQDDRSLWQGDFTAVGTGTLSYTEMGLNGVSTDYVFPHGKQGDYKLWEASGARDYGVFQIVEVDRWGNILLTGYDLDSETLLFTRRIDRPIKPSAFQTNEEKARSAPSPEFPKGSVCRIETDGEGETVLWVPQAESSAFIESYCAEIYLGDTCVETLYALSGQIFCPIPREIRICLGRRTEQTYTVRIYAVGAYGQRSEEPLTVTLPRE